MDFFINCLHKVCLKNPCTKEEFEKKSPAQKLLFRREILNEVYFITAFFDCYRLSYEQTKSCQHITSR
jgi:hypothetical protein